MDNDYRAKVEHFVRFGASLIAADVPARYGSGAPWNPDRPLEPGFIPPDSEARVTILSWYPNDGDLRGDVDYHAVRDNFARWGRDASLESYRVAYGDWIASLPVIPFYRKHTLPVLTALRLEPHEVAWLPLIKLPMRPQSQPSEEIIRLDREDTWAQIHSLKPRVVWIQGVSTTEEWIGRQVREQITELIAVQNINERRTTAQSEEIIAGVVRKLQWCFERDAEST
jgi:hypothetical protein